MKSMELKTRYQVFIIQGEGNPYQRTFTLAQPNREENNIYESEYEAMEWIRQRSPQEKYTKYVILPIYSME